MYFRWKLFGCILGFTPFTRAAILGTYSRAAGGNTIQQTGKFFGDNFTFFFFNNVYWSCDEWSCVIGVEIILTWTNQANNTIDIGRRRCVWAKWGWNVAGIARIFKVLQGPTEKGKLQFFLDRIVGDFYSWVAQFANGIQRYSICQRYRTT